MTAFQHALRRPTGARLAVVGAVAAGALVLAGCGDNGNDAGSGSTSSPSHHHSAESPATGTFNNADVKFAQMMIPHHQQAVEMAKLAPGRASAQEVKDLAGKIEKAQDPEIKTMKSWLESWGKPVSPSESGMDHGSGGMDHGSGMPGMMSDKDMKMLKAAKGKKFDREFATMMIDHHKGAITMAKDEQKNSRNADAKKLAGKIIKAQTAEISELNKILDRT